MLDVNVAFFVMNDDQLDTSSCCTREECCDRGTRRPKIHSVDQDRIASDVQQIHQKRDFERGHTVSLRTQSGGNTVLDRQKRKGYRNKEEMTAVLGTITDNDFLNELKVDTEQFNSMLKNMFSQLCKN